MTDLSARRPTVFATAQDSDHPLRSAAIWFERAVCIIGVLMLLEVARFLVAGNSEALDPRDPAAGNPAARAVWYPFYAAFAAILFIRVRTFLTAAVHVWPLYLLLALSAASLFWSVAPDVTLRRIIAISFTVLFGVHLAVRGPWKESLKLVGIAVMIAAAGHLLVVGLNPSMGVDQGLHAGAWKGMSTEKNALGGDMARAAVVMLALTFVDARRRWWWAVGLGMTSLLALGSTSTTSLLALVVLFGLFGFFLIARRSAAASVVMIYVGVTAAGAALVVITLFPAAVVALFGKDLTLTGRTDIWQLCARAIMDQPFTGYGLGAFWLDLQGPSAAVRDLLEWVVPSAHNNWIEMGLDLGLPGVALLAFIVFSALGKGALRLFTIDNPFMLIAVAQLFLFSMSESAIFWFQNTFATTMFVFFAALALRPARFSTVD